MKRVVLVLSLLMMSLFVSGYTFEAEMTIKDDNKVSFKKTFTFAQDEVKAKACGENSDCILDDQTVRSGLVDFMSLDKTNAKVAAENVSVQNSDKITITYNYDLGDIDDYVGPGYDKFDLYSSNFSFNLFKINGYDYKSNIFFEKEDPSITSAKFKLIVPKKLDNTTGKLTNKDNNTYEWDLNITPETEFIYKANANKEVTGDKDYGKIKVNKYMMIAAGVIGGLIVILAFVNIIKKDKSLQQTEVVQEEKPVFNSEIFNERASVSKPSEMVNNEDTFVPLDESQHEDVISHTFLDASFAGDRTPEVQEPVEEPSAEPVVLSENKIDEAPAEEKPVEETPVEEEPNNDDNSHDEPIQNDMSSLAFGGTPIDDKNINEIK